MRPRTEKVVKGRLLANEIDHYLPVIPKARMHHKTKITTYVPMIPGYIFLCVNDEERYSLKRTEEKIIQIELQRDEYLESVLIRELNALQKCEILAKEEPILINPGIQRGDKVLVSSGSLKGLVADVVNRDDENNVIIINITILDKHIEYPVSTHTLKLITS